MKPLHNTRKYRLFQGQRDLVRAYCAVADLGLVGGFKLTGWALWRRMLRRVLRLQDQMFDRRHTIQTEGDVELNHLKALHGDPKHSAGYEPMHVAQFPHLMATIPEDLNDFTFIDFGAGKGRAVLLAARYPFKKAIGVEFSEDLCHRMRDNIASYSNGPRLCPDIEVACADATTFELPPTPCVLFFFNPFNKPILIQVARNIHTSYSANPRTIYIVFLNPKESNGAEDVFGQYPEMTKVSTKLERPPFSIISPWRGIVYRMGK
ncbi:class I SAM-dependent methyltransferase [Azospirillum soli]|uniref:class I SAM-dependent methyltransferase n=1 Tax=Azospirillum soli TaxID=1304799 RepID=UPI001AE6C567|nr:class I SAM-dependent methyltransferase [Azospirillum soli]MBP2312174.1 SAM-dependent methyltransferase [Azospirillum soli]